ncbi:MAG: T9SS C-terminal target domain-containing protein [Bacteroidetes bacterium]|nr:T9SS C-terminal target domain-containing protein [Bacteroidota bacterium]
MKKIKNSFILKWTLLLLFSTTIAFAQEIEWQNTIGGGSIDYLNSIQQTSDGGYILGGYSNSSISGDKTENSIGGYDCWIIKLMPQGSIQWQNTIGGSSEEGLSSVHPTSDGGYIVCGTSDSNISGDKTENSLGGQDYWIVKMDSAGSIQWQNTIGGDDTDVLRAIQQTSDGGFILGGYSKSSNSGDKTENCWGVTDYWIVKTDSLGSIQWQNTIGGSLTDVLQSIIQTSDGGYILGGYSESNISGNKTENSLGSGDCWIVKTDSLGNIQWQNTIGGNGIDEVASICQTTDGGYILGCVSESNISGDKTENSLGSFDFWIVKTDVAGNIQWQNTIGSSVSDQFSVVQQTPDDGYILGGSSSSKISGDKTESSLFVDYWIIKTDPMGNILWQNVIGGSHVEMLKTIDQTADGCYVFGGYSRSDSSNDKSENSIGSSDYWFMKLSDNYNFIVGQLFADLNSNGFKDIGEPPITGRKITESTSGRFAFTEQNGRYTIGVVDTGNFNVFPQTVNWFGATPALHIASFTGISQTYSLNDFAYQPQGTFEDVCITITPLGNFRSGFNASYMISYGNYGNTTVTPTVYFYPYSNVTFQSATFTPNQIFPDSVIWNLPALTPFQTGSIIVTVNVNPGLYRNPHQQQRAY